MPEASFQHLTIPISGEEPEIGDAYNGELVINTAEGRLWVGDESQVPIELGGAVKAHPIGSPEVCNFVNYYISSSESLPIKTVNPLEIPQGYYEYARYQITFTEDEEDLAPINITFDHSIRWEYSLNPIQTLKSPGRSIIFDLVSFGPAPYLTGKVVWISDYNQTNEPVDIPLLVEGAGIELTSDDLANTITIASTITQYTDEQVDDRVASLLTEGANITLNYNDAAGTLTINSTASGGLTEEQVDDRVASLLVEGAGIDLTYDDGANTITVASTITQYTDEQVDDRVAALLTEGTNITLSYNDAAGTLTINSTASGGGGLTLENLYDVLCLFPIRKTIYMHVDLWAETVVDPLISRSIFEDFDESFVTSLLFDNFYTLRVKSASYFTNLLTIGVEYTSDGTTLTLEENGDLYYAPHWNEYSGPLDVVFEAVNDLDVVVYEGRLQVDLVLLPRAYTITPKDPLSGGGS
jgi:ribulose bisphosphate carboxylase small subunit